MNTKLLLSMAIAITISACKDTSSAKQDLPKDSLSGTWNLVSARLISKGDTTTTFPVEGQKMIKIFNGSHFAFFKHDLSKGAQQGIFEAGSGSYKLSGEDYSEHLEYCSFRAWENTDFKFKLSIHNDTLIQKGVEKIDSLNVNHEIIETYVKN